jgi:hypothetical protein
MGRAGLPEDDAAEPAGTSADDPIPDGGFYEEPHSTATPQSVTWQAAYSDGVLDHVATAWTTGQDIGTTSCIFIGQGVTTG